MIIDYHKKLQNDGVNVSSEVADANIIDVPDSNNDKNNNYVDLDTVGAVFESREIAVVIIVYFELVFIFYHKILFNSIHYMHFLHNIFVFALNIKYFSMK